MSIVTVSTKFQVVIPKEVREALDIRPGTKVHAIAYEGRIELIPVPDIVALQGFLRGIDTTLEREPDRL